MLARSPNSAGPPGGKGTLLIAAVSGRALAQAARRAGWRVLVADFFGDEDTRAAADAWARLPGSLRYGVDGGSVLEALQWLVSGASGLDAALPLVRARHSGSPLSFVQDTVRPQARSLDGQRVDALILGSGFERLPGLVDELARHFPLAGCGGEAIRLAKNPRWLAWACEELGIPHPEISFELPADARGWVTKAAGGAGGAHVGAASGRAASSGRYFQRRVEGDSISVLFAADRNRAHVAGFSLQWTSPVPAAPYRYGGAVRLPGLERPGADRMQGWLDGLTRLAQLEGLCSADFIRAGDRTVLIEINPRPGATLDIFDHADAPLIDAHIDACRGLPPALPVHDGSAASLVAYTQASIAAFPQMHWPAWTADRQSAGSRLGAGDPVCTVFGEGATATEARRQAAERLDGLECQWSSS